MQKSPTCYVLVVEDDPHIREAMRELLEIEGYTVVEAANGSEALARVRDCEGEPCLILLDLMMPVMDGWEFLSVVRDDGALAGIPIAVVSAVVDKARLPEGTQYLRKPVDMETLLHTVAGHCAGAARA